MKLTALAFSVAAALVLAGCDGTSSPAGAGTGTTERDTTSVSETVSREKALRVAREQGTAQEVQLAGLIIAAVQELRPTYQGSRDWLELNEMICGLGIEPEKRQEMAELVANSNGVSVAPGTELGIFSTGTEADFNAACLAWMWELSTTPFFGWPRTNARAFSVAAMQEQVQWASTRTGFGLGASATMAPLAAELAKHPGASVEELKQMARELLLANANEWRPLFTAQAIQARDSADQVRLNLTGSSPAPVHYTHGRNDIQISGAGMLVTADGTTRFGSGYLEGVKYTVEAVASSGQSMNRSSASATSTDSTNIRATNAEARTQ